MKLKNLYVIFIFLLSFNGKSQSNKIKTPVLANSETLINDTLKNKMQVNSHKLSTQESKVENKNAPISQDASLKFSEALKSENMKDEPVPKN